MSTYPNPHARAALILRTSMRLIHRHRSFEYWVRYDETAEVWEMFAEQEAEAYLGCFDSRADALAYAKRHAVEG